MAPHDTNVFHAFPRMPPELRCLVWQHAAFPRILTLTQRPGPRRRNPKYIDDDYYYYFFYDSVPAVLHTCRESRRWAPYVRAFRNVVCNGGKSDRYIWVNFDLDTVRLVDDAIYLEKLGDADNATIRSMILHFDETCEFLDLITDPLENTKSLKSLQIHVACGSLGSWFWEVRWFEARFNRWFGGRNDGWVCPEIRVTDLESGFEVNRENHRIHCDLAPCSSPRACLPSPPGVRGGRGGRGRGHRGSRGGMITRS